MSSAVTQTPVQPQGEQCDALTVMFDGSCPLCRREIAVYQALTPLRPVSWRDISGDKTGLTQTDQARYMARFHVQLQDGQQISGAAAFAALWLAMPGWRWLGRVCQIPGVTAVLEWVYRAFLYLRPSLQRWARHAESVKEK